MKKLMMVLAAMACMVAAAKEGKIEISFDFVRMRGRMHSDGLVILRDKKKPVICRMRKLNDDERENAFVKWGEPSGNAFVMPVDGRGKVFLFVRETFSRDGLERKEGIAYILDMGGRWARGIFSMRDLGWSENDIWGNCGFATGGEK